MERYYYDELLCMLDEYNDINSLDKDRKEEVFADEME